MANKFALRVFARSLEERKSPKRNTVFIFLLKFEVLKLSRLGFETVTYVLVRQHTTLKNTATSFLFLYLMLKSILIILLIVQKLNFSNMKKTKHTLTFNFPENV